jgi:hypothetical protein
MLIDDNIAKRSLANDMVVVWWWWYGGGGGVVVYGETVANGSTISARL